MQLHIDFRDFDDRNDGRKEKKVSEYGTKRIECVSAPFYIWKDKKASLPNFLALELRDDPRGLSVALHLHRSILSSMCLSLYVSFSPSLAFPLPLLSSPSPSLFVHFFKGRLRTSIRIGNNFENLPRQSRICMRRNFKERQMQSLVEIEVWNK